MAAKFEIISQTSNHAARERSFWLQVPQKSSKIRNYHSCQSRHTKGQNYQFGSKYFKCNDIITPKNKNLIKYKFFPKKKNNIRSINYLSFFHPGDK